MLSQRGKKYVVPELVLVLDHLEDFHANRLKGLARAHAVGAGIVRFVLDLLLDASDAHLEEFVEIRGHDAEKADALEQRLAGVLSLFEYPGD